MDRSRIAGFYNMSVEERLCELRNRNFLTEDEFEVLNSRKNILNTDDADRMIENVIGVFCLPIGLGVNFLINGKDYVVPMVVEEPSIVAAVSSAAKTARPSGGYISKMESSLLIGQVQVVDLENSSRAQQALLQNKVQILNLANSLHPRMVARGGGAVDLEVVLHPRSTHRGDMLVVHLLVDTQDAMGANLVNSMCEGVAALIEKISGGKVFLRILSNLTDRSIVRTEVHIAVEDLATKKTSGEEVRDGIILANEFAAVDPYRAATHNKGIMNGIDAVALATGNDWRAIEAAAHAYAARGKSYTSLTKWFKGDRGQLVGILEIPLKVGTVGGPLQSNPAVKVLHGVSQVKTARELAELMGAVGLAQNFAALRALSTEGIQRGHMSLHARSVALAAGATPEIFEEVVERLVNDGSIKIWKAEEIVSELRQSNLHLSAGRTEADLLKKNPELSAGGGKLILFGEHAVVYGSHAIAAPVPLAIEAKVEETNNGVHVIIPRWGVETTLERGVKQRHSIYESLSLILESLGLSNRGMKIEIFPHIPRAMGLGGSAALAVAVIRALSRCFQLNLSDSEVNRLAFQSEQIVHGAPSGIDNTVATFGNFMLFRKGSGDAQRIIKPAVPLSLVVAISGVESLTAKMVAKVRAAWSADHSTYDALFGRIDALTLEAMQAIEQGEVGVLGKLLTKNQQLLRELEVSSPELDQIIELALRSGALGAKLSGAGGGGVAFALAEDQDSASRIKSAIQSAGYEALQMVLE